MPNTQTSVPAFSSGQVLTAAQMTEVNTGIPVFATTTTRDAAFGGTGEKTLAEGQFAYIEASNTTQYYDGAAWQTVGGGLAVVQPETALSAAATLTLDGCFTSSYTNYRLHLNVTGASTVYPVLQLRTGGVAATTNYNKQYIDASSTTLSGGRVTSQTNYELGVLESDFRGTFIIEIFQPQLPQYTNFYTQNIYSSGTSTTNVVWTQNCGIHSAATAYDGFIITFGANATGTYSLYGYGK